MEDAEADLIIGADGAHSKIRKIMTRRPLFNYAQTYIQHGYVELSMPCRGDNEVSEKISLNAIEAFLIILHFLIIYEFIKILLQSL